MVYSTKSRAADAPAGSLCRGRDVQSNCLRACLVSSRITATNYVAVPATPIPSKPDGCSRRAVYHWLHGATPQPFRRELIIKAMDEHERRALRLNVRSTEACRVREGPG